MILKLTAALSFSLGYLFLEKRESLEADYLLEVDRSIILFLGNPFLEERESLEAN
jgi:hypothetical protein